MLTRRTALITGAVAFSLSALPAHAHRAARSETEIRFRENGTVAVIHAFHLQDAQDALFGGGLIDKPDLASLRNRAKLALYTSDRFSVSLDGDAIPLEIIGAEIEGATVYVYQEGLSTGSGTVSIRAGMLHDLVDRHLISVNIIRGHRVVTLDFREGSGSKSVEGLTPAP